MNIWMLPGFSCRDLVAFPIIYNDGEAERHSVVFSTYFPYDSKDPPLSREFEELISYCEEENIYLVIGYDPNTHHMVWVTPLAGIGGVALLEFLNSSMEILNQGNDPTYYSAVRLEVLDITMGSFGLLENFKRWEVSSEPSLLDHRHILFFSFSGFCTGMPDQES